MLSHRQWRWWQRCSNILVQNLVFTWQQWCFFLFFTICSNMFLIWYLVWQVFSSSSRQPVRLRYRYTVPRQLQDNRVETERPSPTTLPPLADRYAWQRGGWAPCSVTCGQGKTMKYYIFVLLSMINNDLCQLMARHHIVMVDIQSSFST